MHTMVSITCISVCVKLPTCEFNKWIHGQNTLQTEKQCPQMMFNIIHQLKLGTDSEKITSCLNTKLHVQL
jgi:hypothetical protein